MSTNTYPKARNEGLVVRELPDEVLVYDLERHKAHCLNETAAAVWRHCDGETSTSEISFRLAREFSTPVDEDVVWLALETLSKSNLLEEPVVRPTPGLSRRDVVRRGALAASVLAVPAVFSVFAPTAGAAVCQPPNNTCLSASDCPSSCPFCCAAAGNTCQPTCA